jgi:replicative DNA helicase
MQRKEGKIQPQANDLEQAVLGAIMLDKSAFDTVSEILHEDCFYNGVHQIIFSAMKKLNSRGVPVDILTVVQELISLGQLDKVGGPFYVTSLTNQVVSAANIEHHSRIVLQKHIQRQIIRMSSELVNLGYDDSTDVFDLMDYAEKSLFAITGMISKNEYKHIKEELPAFLDHVELLSLKDEQVTGVPSGFRELDRVTNGWQPTDLIIIAARPSVGKTAFALNIARNAAMDQHKSTNVGLFSIEMSSQQLIQRIMSREAGINMGALSRGRVGRFEVLAAAAENLMQANIYIDDSSSLNLYELKSKARKMVKKHEVGLIIIDYLQLMQGETKKNSNREQEISTISRSLKALAKELNVPVIALSQLSRDVEKRAEKVPQLSDLRESGAIEQDADMVMFLYRPSESERLADAELENKGMAKIAKHRNGSLESFAFEVDNSIQTWKEIGVLGYEKTQAVGVRKQGEEMPF